MEGITQRRVAYLLIYLFVNLSVAFSAQRSRRDSIVDSRRWNIADKTFKDGHCERACSLYYDLVDRGTVIYRDINSRKVEDLQKRYSIDEVQLKKDIEKNKQLRLLGIALITFSAIVFIIGIIIRKQNKQLKKSKKDMEHAKETIKEFLKQDGTGLMECMIDPMDLVK